MSDQQAIRMALDAAGIDDRLESMHAMSGGCIHKAYRVKLANQGELVAKVNHARMLRHFQEEADGLRAITTTQTILAPAPLLACKAADRSVLLLSMISTRSWPSTADDWRRFGRELAALHLADPVAVCGRNGYGFSADNHLGTTLQPNAWHEDWVEFNRLNRLGYQIELARNNDLLEHSEHALLERVMQTLDQLIPHGPRPSLIHGDLWSGNVLATSDREGAARFAVIDPACSIGDGWADIAMMHLFGGFHSSCFETYAELIPQPADLETRLAVYRLYHVLNHLNLFGRGYAGQVTEIARSLV